MCILLLIKNMCVYIYHTGIDCQQYACELACCWWSNDLATAPYSEWLQHNQLLGGANSCLSSWLHNNTAGCTATGKSVVVCVWQWWGWGGCRGGGTVQHLLYASAVEFSVARWRAVQRLRRVLCSGFEVIKQACGLSASQGEAFVDVFMSL